MCSVRYVCTCTCMMYSALAATSFGYFTFSVKNVYFIGFDHLHKWFICGGEVFRIYAYGKNDGAALDEEDDIVLYFPAGGSYARFPSNGGVGVNACPLGQLPPASDKFDHCLENLIKVTVK